LETHRALNSLQKAGELKQRTKTFAIRIVKLFGLGRTRRMRRPWGNRSFVLELPLQQTTGPLAALVPKPSS